MNKRRDEYLNLVLDILLEDSIITHSNRNWWLESPWIQNLPWIQDNGIVTPHVGLFKYMLPYTLNSTSDPFGKYCRDNYGLTDKEIYDMWRIYHDEMWKIYYKLSSGKLNESIDRRTDYLDKIVDFLVEDTKMDYDTHKVWYPFMSNDINPFPFSPNTIFSIEVSPVFVDYLNTIYGIDWYDSDYVWKKYMTIMMNKYKNDIIKESVDRRTDYLDKIVDFLVEDTDIGLGWFHPPYFYPGSTAGRTGFRSVYEHTFNLSSNTNYSGLDTQLIYFDNYCKNNYGLTGQENLIVWERYMKKLYETYKWGF